MRSVNETINTMSISTFSYSENVEDVKIEILWLIGGTTNYLTDLLSDTARKRKNILNEFIYPYREDFKIIDAYIAKIHDGLLILNQRLSVKQYRSDNEYEKIKEQFILLENQLIPELAEKQAKRKQKNLSILATVILFHVIFYAWLLSYFN